MTPQAAAGGCPKHPVDDSIYRLRDRELLTLCVPALLALGVVMVQSASTNLG